MKPAACGWERFARVARIAATGAVTALSALVGVADAAEAGALRTTHVAGNVYMITGAGGNVAVSAGPNGVLVVDTGAPEHSDELLAAIRAVSGGAIRYVINTGLSPHHVGGNAQLRAAGETYTGGNATVVAGVDEGAAIIAHENTLLRMAAMPSFDIDAHPTETFFIPKYDLYFNGEPVELMYRPAAVDDTNLTVHFRRSDVIIAGDVFRLDGYPFIDIERGGSIDGILAALNDLVDLAVSDTLAEGGTLIVPGHGRIADEGDLVRYRDMLTIIRDRMRALIDRGYGLAEIEAAQPTFEYDSRYGSTAEGWTAERFIEAAYRSLVEASESPAGGSSRSRE
jgi:cyclase